MFSLLKPQPLCTHAHADAHAHTGNRRTFRILFSHGQRQACGKHTVGIMHRTRHVGRPTNPRLNAASTHFSTRPKLSSCPTTPFTVSMGIANETPEYEPVWVGSRMAELIPITLPLTSSKGPPLLPGLTTASVWMTPLIGRPSEGELMTRPRPVRQYRHRISEDQHLV